MIHCNVRRNPDASLQEVHLSFTAESVASLLQLINRATNTWDNAPEDIKELAHRLTNPPHIVYPSITNR